MMRGKNIGKGILFLLLIMMLSFTAAAAYDSAGQRVFDSGDLLTASEEQKLESRISSMAKKLNLDIIIVTTQDTGGKSARVYADDFYDSYDFGTMSAKDYPSGVLFLLDMDNREIYISTETEREKRFSDQQIDLILDNIYDYVVDGNYYGACNAFLKGVEKYAGNNNGIHWLLRIVFALVIGAIGVTIMIFSSKSKVTANGRTYLAGSGVDILHRNDRFTHTTVIKRKIQTNNNSSGGSGGARTHTSSSGRSHGGGGRKF